MANVLATHSVGNSLITWLRNSYPTTLSKTQPFDFRLLSTGEIADGPEPRNTVSLFLFRVTLNEHMRTRRRSNDFSDAEAPLSLDLHFLLTAWADNALAEQTVVSWVMRHLQLHPVLDSSSLSPEADWDRNDVIQVIPSELSSEELFRIWDLLQPKYRLSVPYIARVVRIDTELEDGPGSSRPVVATRFAYSDRESLP